MNRRVLAGLEEVTRYNRFKVHWILVLCDFPNNGLLVCIEECVVVIWNVILLPNQSVAHSTDDSVVYLLWDCIAQCVEEPMQYLHRSDERKRLPPVHDPVITRRACQDTRPVLGGFRCGLFVRVLALL
jgi:hypothetical protein